MVSQTEVVEVIAATGSRPAVRCTVFPGASVRSQLSVSGAPPGAPFWFQSLVSDLFFAGQVAVESFSQLFGFADGAKFATRQLPAHLARARGLNRPTVAGARQCAEYDLQ
jgi:hypothetical protein